MQVPSADFLLKTEIRRTLVQNTSSSISSIKTASITYSSTKTAPDKLTLLELCYPTIRLTQKAIRSFHYNTKINNNNWQLMLSTFQTKASCTNLPPANNYSNIHSQQQTLTKQASTSSSPSLSNNHPLNNSSNNNKTPPTDQVEIYNTITPFLSAEMMKVRFQA